MVTPNLCCSCIEIRYLLTVGILATPRSWIKKAYDCQGGRVNGHMIHLQNGCDSTTKTGAEETQINSQMGKQNHTVFVGAHFTF